MSRPSGDPIEGLLLEPCEHGRCEALRDLDRAAAAHMTIDELTDAVLQAEGLEPALASRPQRPRRAQRRRPLEPELSQNRRPLPSGSTGSLRDVDPTELIDVRPGVRSGKPCFVGTRIAVYDVLEYLASGMTHEEIVADFPELTEAHIRAALEFAALRERRLATPA